MKTAQNLNNDQNKKNHVKSFSLVVFIVFLIINFAGLYLGSLSTSKAVLADWYLSLNKSPITPPGWFFGFAWSTIMICYAFYMAKAYSAVQSKQKLISLFSIQWLLNFLWNPVFFAMHNISLGLVVIVALTLIVATFILYYRKTLEGYSLLLLPYIFWLCVASYLNFYILLNN